MEAIRMLLLAGVIGATLVYGGVHAKRALEDRAEVSSPALQTEVSSPALQTEVLTAVPQAEDVAAREVVLADEPSALRLAELDALFAAANAEDIVLEGGFRIGAFELSRRHDETITDEPTEVEASVAVESRATPRRAPRTRRPRRPPAPRLHPNPGRHTILVARQMMARNEVIRGSCYRYLSEVFERAGHHGWRSRRIVYREGRTGPYADLNLIRPGDWLYIVNDPNRTPVGTHSVMFVGWQDRARGYARVISHPGWHSPSAGRERGYDVSRTYRIIRPVSAE